MKHEIMTKKRFQAEVLDRHRAFKCSYMEAILEVCKDNNIEPTDVARFIDGSLKERIECEAQGLNMLKDKSTTGNLLNVMEDDE